MRNDDHRKRKIEIYETKRNENETIFEGGIQYNCTIKIQIKRSRDKNQKMGAIKKYWTRDVDD